VPPVGDEKWEPMGIGRARRRIARSADLL